MGERCGEFAMHILLQTVYCNPLNCVSVSCMRFLFMGDSNEFSMARGPLGGSGQSLRHKYFNDLLTKHGEDKKERNCCMLHEIVRE